MGILILSSFFGSGFITIKQKRYSTGMQIIYSRELTQFASSYLKDFLSPCNVSQIKANFFRQITISKGCFPERTWNQVEIQDNGAWKEGEVLFKLHSYFNARWIFPSPIVAPSDIHTDWVLSFSALWGQSDKVWPCTHPCAQK